MQTFLPLPDYWQSARSLDRMRLGKQRAEVLQLLAATDDRGWTGWSNHAAARMWIGHRMSLAHYGIVVCRVWMQRGYKDTCFAKTLAYVGNPSLLDIIDAPKPSWFGDDAFHASHRSNLLRKLPEHYEQFGWTEPPTLDYVWPR